jgi:hypothetical protein
VNCARPFESDALRAAPLSTASETVPVGGPAEEPTVTMTVAVAVYGTVGAVIVIVVATVDPDVGLVALLTVTATGADVVVFPFVSYARAVHV